MSVRSCEAFALALCAREALYHIRESSLGLAVFTGVGLESECQTLGRTRHGLSRLSLKLGLITAVRLYSRKGEANDEREFQEPEAEGRP
jgi:hypothetical protein